jgi:hypothetical protein
MLRSIPSALDPGPRPTFTAPVDVIAWLLSVDWLIRADRALVLHVGTIGELTCVASCWGRLQHLGALSWDGMAHDAAECDAAGVVVVDVRRRPPARVPSEADRRLHQALRTRLAISAVALLDTVVAWPGGGASVTEALTFPLPSQPSWLSIHLPGTSVPTPGWEWSHEDASGFPTSPGGRPDAVVLRPELWTRDVGPAD